MPALAELVDTQLVRILDVAFIKKDPHGTTTMFEYDTLDDVLAFGFDGEAGGVLNDEDLELAAQALEPDSPAALIVWEHLWAARAAQAIQVDRWVQSACVLCSNGCWLDIAAAAGRTVGVRGHAEDRVNHGRLGPKGLFGWDPRGCSAGRPITRPTADPPAGPRRR